MTPLGGTRTSLPTILTPLTTAVPSKNNENGVFFLNEELRNCELIECWRHREMCLIPFLVLK
jgi:hypothetical protein